MIAALLISMLKTMRLYKKLASRAFRASNNEVVEFGDDRTNEMVVTLSKNKKCKKLTHVAIIRAIERFNFLTPNAKKAFYYLWLAFIKALIL